MLWLKKHDIIRGGGLCKRKRGGDILGGGRPGAGQTKGKGIPTKVNSKVSIENRVP